MPHFYFDTRSGDEVLLDESGHEFASVEDARQTAVIALLDMAREKKPPTLIDWISRLM